MVDFLRFDECQSSFTAAMTITCFASGVVFNEMKGVYSQPDNVLGRVSQQVRALLWIFIWARYCVRCSEDVN